MKPIDFIASYMKLEATPMERARIKEILQSLEAPPLNADEVIARLHHRCKVMFNGNNRLDVVKHVKEITGWGLKECKEWCDTNIFDVKHMQG